MRQDEQAQKKGFVKIVYNVGVSGAPSIDRELMFHGAPIIFEALPFRMAAMHFCYDKPIMRPALAAVQHVIGRSGRVRFRAHCGKDWCSGRGSDYI